MRLRATFPDESTTSAFPESELDEAAEAYEQDAEVETPRRAVAKKTAAPRKKKIAAPDTTTKSKSVEKSQIEKVINFIGTIIPTLTCIWKAAPTSVYHIAEPHIEALVQASMDSPHFAFLDRPVDLSVFKWDYDGAILDATDPTHIKSTPTSVTRTAVKKSRAPRRAKRTVSSSSIHDLDGNYNIRDLVYRDDLYSYTPNIPLNIREGLYPSARHLYFSIWVLTIANNSYISNDSVVQLRSVGPLLPERKHGSYTLQYGLSVIRTAFSAITNQAENLFYDSGLNLRTGYCRGETARQYDEHVASENYTQFGIVTAYDDRPLILTIEELLQKDQEELHDLIESKFLSLHRPSINSGMCRNMHIFSNVLIEGLHFNKHRRPEIESYIRTFAGFTKDELYCIVEGEEMAGVYLNGYSENFHSKNLTDLAFFDNNFDLLSEFETVLIFDTYFVTNPIRALKIIQKEGTSYMPTDEEIEDMVVRNSVKSLRDKVRQINANINDTQASLISYIDQKHLVELEIKRVSSRTRAEANALVAELRSMDMLAKVELLPQYLIAMETKEIYARHGSGDVMLGEDVEDISDSPLRGSYYVGVYQLLLNPMDGALSVRNIAAPLGVETSEISTTRSQLPGLELPVFSLFHPHSSIDLRNSDVCLGSYRYAMHTSSVNDMPTEIAQHFKERLASALLFLQSFNRTDANVTYTAHTLAPKRQDRVGITSWQMFTGSGQSIPYVHAVFGIPHHKAPPVIDLKADLCDWKALKHAHKDTDFPETISVEMFHKFKRKDES